MNPKAPSLIAAFAALSVLPAAAQVVFSESFEAPVVSGFDDNTVPSGGKWIGSSGAFNASLRGLYNESVVWPATPPFTTPYGEQGYSLNYSTTMLTTAQGATGQTITADVTYTLTFHAAKVVGTSADYLAHLVAFGAADDNTARQNPNSMAGTIVAQATGAITASDMSDLVTIVFTPDASNPHLGKELGIRFDKDDGDAIYDNVRLIVGHDLNPDPANGEDLSAGGNVTLSWTNLPPNTGDTYVDVWFGNTSGTLSQVVDGQIISSTIVSAPSAGTWYWRVDSYPDGDPNGIPVVGQEFSFTIADTDGDGIPDTWEQQYFGGPTAADAGLDSDTDGSSNLAEYIRGTNPNNPDTDADGLLDGVESATGTWVSASNTGTLPLVADTDADGLLDGVETNTGTWVSTANTGTSPLDPDWDKDGVLDGVETNTGTYANNQNSGTDPYDADSDNDGVGDYYEIYAALTNPLVDTEKPPVPYPLPDPDADTGVTNKPVKVYIMSGQSNMVGQGIINGTGDTSLTYLTGLNRFPNLVDGSGNWTTRQDVRFRGVISDFAAGQLSPGVLGGAATPSSADNDNFIGPELGFGHIMGWYHDQPVLLLKSCTGNRGLGWDILPPGTPGWVYEGSAFAGYGQAPAKRAVGAPLGDPIASGWWAGKEYDRFFMHEADWGVPAAPDINVVDILDNFATEYPDWANQGFEIAGFVWWQGDKDRYDMGYATQYKQNLTNLIYSLRNYYQNRYNNDKDGNGNPKTLTATAVNAPFVLATLGQTPLTGGNSAEEQEIIDAMMAVDGEVSNVKTVYSYPLNQGGASNTHYNQNATTYMLVGDALGRAMHELLETASGPDENPPVATSFNPANGASDVSTGANLVANFNESIAIGTGNITIHPIDNSGDLVIAVTDAAQVSVSGNVLTINPTANLSPSKQYAVQIDATAIDDLAGNSYAGIADNTTWSFTTADPDLTAPTLSSTNPTNGASGVLVDTNLVATFSEPIALGTGNITLHPTDNSGDMVIPVTDGSQISVSGAVLTINPTADLVGGKTYAVRIDATAIDDLVGNSYDGIIDDVTWSFSMVTPPPAGVVFSDDFESPNAGTSYTIANTSGLADGTKWVRTNTSAFGAGRSGIVDENRVGETFVDPGGEQAYALRYSSNTGLTSAYQQIGTLAAGQTITVSFDVTIQNFNGTDYTPYKCAILLFDGAGTRNVVTSGFQDNAAAQLAVKTGNANSASYQNVTFSYTVGDNVVDNNGAAAGVSTAWNSSLLGKDIAIRFGGVGYSAIFDNVQVSITGPGGPGPVESFVISPIASPQTVGIPITGITITAKDASNNTATGFTGTVTFGGTGGFSGTSASFNEGVLTGVSVTPTFAGSNLTLTVSGSGKSGSTTIGTIQTQYAAWSGGAAFDADANNDGIDNGMAWVLGASGPNASAIGLLPTIDNSDATWLVFNYRRSDAALAAGTTIAAHYGTGLDGWTTAVAGPDVIITPTDNAHGTNPGIDKVEVKIRRTLAPGGKLFVRLVATP